MPLNFEFEGKGVNFEQFVGDFARFDTLKRKFVSEPTSILDNIVSSPSPPTSSSTLSSSLGNGGGGGGGGGCFAETASVAAVSGNPSQKWLPESQETTSSNVGGIAAELFHPFPSPSLEISGSGPGGAAVTAAGTEKCGGIGLEEWDNDGQEQSLLRWIMGDVEDPSMGLNKVLSAATAVGDGGGPGDFEFNNFGVVDQGFGLDSNHPVGQFQHKLGLAQTLQQNQMFSANLPPILSPPPNLNQPQTFPFEVKPQIFNPQLLINQHQSQQPPQNPAFFLPLPYQNEEHQLLGPPQPKRHNPGTLESNPNTPKGPFLDPGLHPNQLNLLPHYLQQRPSLGSKKMAMDEQLGSHQEQQQIIDQLFKAADLVQSGSNLILAQGILARLNQQLSPIGKPFHRAAFYFKEAIQSLLHSIVNNMNPPQTSSISSPFSLIFKIGAYKSFSEISPFVQFANFTCNQALLEVLDGYDQIHVVDFDIGYGGQWASLLQELALRGNGAPSLKITAFASPSTHDQLELSLTRENLCQFASEISMAFEFEIVNIDVLTSSSWSMPIHVMETEAIAVNLPVGSFSNYQIPLPLVLRFVKNLSPKIIVSMDRGADRTDLAFSNHVIHALQSYSNLLESLDAVNVNLDSLQKIERFLIQPSIEKIVMGRYRFPEKAQHWRSLFLSAGFYPLTFSNFTESQAECVVKRTPVRGFHVEKRLSSLVLCWQRRELVSVSAWRC